MHFAGLDTLPGDFESPMIVASTQNRQSRWRATRSRRVPRSANAYAVRRVPGGRRTALSFPVRVCRVRSLHSAAALQPPSFLHARYGSVRDTSSRLRTPDDSVHPTLRSGATSGPSRVRMKVRAPASVLHCLHDGALLSQPYGGRFLPTDV